MYRRPADAPSLPTPGIHPFPTFSSHHPFKTHTTHINHQSHQPTSTHPPTHRTRQYIPVPNSTPSLLPPHHLTIPFRPYVFPTIQFPLYFHTTQPYLTSPLSPNTPTRQQPPFQHFTHPPTHVFLLSFLLSLDFHNVTHTVTERGLSLLATGDTQACDVQ